MILFRDIGPMGGGGGGGGGWGVWGGGDHRLEGRWGGRAHSSASVPSVGASVPLRPGVSFLRFKKGCWASIRCAF